MKITYDMLRYAYQDEYVAFKTEWPDGMELTVPNLLRAVELGISIDWLAETVLDDTDRYYEVRLNAFTKITGGVVRATRAFRDSGEADFTPWMAPYLATVNLTTARTLVWEARYQEIAIECEETP